MWSWQLRQPTGDVMASGTFSEGLARASTGMARLRSRLTTSLQGQQPLKVAVVIYDDEHYAMGGALAERFSTGMAVKVTLVTPDSLKFSAWTADDRRAALTFRSETARDGRGTCDFLHKRIAALSQSAGRVQLDCIYTGRSRRTISFDTSDYGDRPPAATRVLFDELAARTGRGSSRGGHQERHPDRRLPCARPPSPMRFMAVIAMPANSMNLLSNAPLRARTAFAQIFRRKLIFGKGTVNECTTKHPAAAVRTARQRRSGWRNRATASWAPDHSTAVRHSNCSARIRLSSIHQAALGIRAGRDRHQGALGPNARARPSLRGRVRGG